MAIQQPIGTNLLPTPDHALSHRVFANDGGAPNKAIVVGGNGNVGIGVDAPTAVLHLKAGTADANTGQIKLENSVLLAAPEAGCIEFSDGRFYVTGTAKQRALDRTSGAVAVATVTVANTSTEITLYTWTLSANALKVGRIYKVHADGIANNALSGDDLTFNLYFGGTLVGTYTPVVGKYTTNAEWCLDANITVRTVGNSGTFAIHTDINLSGAATESASLGSIDTTIAETIVIKAKWNNAKTGNTVSLYQSFLEFKN